MGKCSKCSNAQASYYDPDDGPGRYCKQCARDVPNVVSRWQKDKKRKAEARGDAVDAGARVEEAEARAKDAEAEMEKAEERAAAAWRATVRAEELQCVPRHSLPGHRAPAQHTV